MSFWEIVAVAVLVVATVALVVISGGAALAAIGAIAAATTTTGVVVGSLVLTAEVAGMYFGVKAIYDYTQDGDEEALFREVALGYLFLGAGKLLEKGFRAWKAARAGDEVVEVLADGVKAGDEIVESGTNITASSKAKSWQGTFPYDGIDIWKDITLKRGKKVIGGVPGQSEYYTTMQGLSKSNRQAEKLWKGLQVKPHPQFGYRKKVAIYEVLDDASAAFGSTNANP
ncbi:MAG: hypothetical protein ACTIJ9_11425 [Aequorivita sp.]